MVDGKAGGVRGAGSPSDEQRCQAEFLFGSPNKREQREPNDYILDTIDRRKDFWQSV